MSISTGTLRNQLRNLLILTNSEIQIAETRATQARTEAVRRELTENAAHGRIRAVAIEKAIRDLGGLPDVLRPVVGRLAASVKALTEQAQPFDEALLGDLALEHQLLDRAIYVKALATAASESDIVALAERLITAHQATVKWLTVVLAEEAIGGPVALRRGPLQAASGAALRIAGIPATLTARGVDRAVDILRSVPVRLGGFADKVEEDGGTAIAAVADTRDNAIRRVAEVGDSVAEQATEAGKAVRKTAKASRDAALDAAEDTARTQGATSAADALHSIRDATGLIDPDDLPIVDYDSLNVNSVVAAVKQLDEPSDIRTVVSYEEAHKDRQGVVSAAQARLAAIAEEIVGMN